jgi:hypothetical protein
LYFWFSAWCGAVWESEEWLKEHVKPLAQSGGTSIHHVSFFRLGINCLIFD